MTKEVQLELLENNDIVPVYITNTGNHVVYGTDLYNTLGAKTDFSTWIKRRFEDCEATEFVDFVRLPKKGEANNATKIEYIIILDTAKEMAMLERNEKGKQVRKYFIEVEKRYKQDKLDRSNLSPELQMVYALADNSARLELEQKRQAEQIKAVETKLNNMQEIFTEPLGDWKADINKRVREISIKSGIDFQSVYNEMYGELETTAHCSLKRLQENKVNRMKKAGNTKTAINEGTTKIAIIYDKPHLKAIFEGIVKRWAMRYCA